ncbi:MAG: LysR substrate-binding domain-containing protein [Pseudomonadales bacterium]
MNTLNLPMELLRSFVVVADCGNVTLAGAQLGRSQPAISLQLKRLETMLERSLFVREANKLHLNDDGWRLLDYAQRILALNDEAAGRFLGPSIAGTVRFGVPSEFATALLPKVIGRFARSYPGVALEVVSNLSAHLMDAYQHHELDLILALHDQQRLARGNRQGHVRHDELVWVGSEQALSRTDKLPLVVAPEGCIYRKRAIEALRKMKKDWDIVYTNPDLGGIKSAIEEGIGLTVLARSTVPIGLPIIKMHELLPDLGSISVSLLYRKSATNPALERLENEIRTALSLERLR